ncbi:N-formylglutamate amidohydrolase [Persephonella atlantica]|uniref:N-formylglutamate amidohydrolase n=1 Tax=Persephonella atlantica TaxID=2699429 RepID=A0ABS1GH53_9AQUI|nr:N-formylglutamate amidohydrolase [Persephonella atlantica]MBK3332273.1 N-formylglutamate amidohydrolase [Persephonella atlantica]
MFPALISIPHGGWKIPEEVKDIVALTDKDIFDDSDPFTVDIYDINGKVIKVIKTDIARAFVDLNRAPDDLPPENPDGVVKTKTCYGVTVYKKPLNREIIDLLLKKYYYPYHREIMKSLKDKRIKIAFDCHSMAVEPPVISPDTGRRPTVCLGNVYGKSCDFHTTELLREAFMEVFGLPEEEVTINKPFAGGYITRTYGNRPVPWIQIEINRKLYLAEPWFDKENLKVDRNRLKKLSKMFIDVLEIFFGRWRG